MSLLSSSPHKKEVPRGSPVETRIVRTIGRVALWFHSAMQSAQNDDLYVVDDKYELWGKAILDVILRLNTFLELHGIVLYFDPNASNEDEETLEILKGTIQTNKQENPDAFESIIIGASGISNNITWTVVPLWNIGSIQFDYAWKYNTLGNSVVKTTIDTSVWHAQNYVNNLLIAIKQWRWWYTRTRAFVRELEDAIDAALTDPLTWIGNRWDCTKYENFLSDQAKEWKLNWCVWFFMLDIDHFKAVNDSLWHAFWDKYLKIFTESVKIFLDSMKWTYPNLRYKFFRLWWEEFKLIISGINEQEIITLWEKLKENMNWVKYNVSPREWRSLIGRELNMTRDASTRRQERTNILMGFKTWKISLDDWMNELESLSVVPEKIVSPSLRWDNLDWSRFIRWTMSMGATIFPAEHFLSDTPHLLTSWHTHTADELSYEVKKWGRDWFRFVVKQGSWDIALNSDEFKAFGQRIKDVQDNPDTPVERTRDRNT